jgi:hypothetical protein
MRRDKAAFSNLRLVSKLQSSVMAISGIRITR